MDFLVVMVGSEAVVEMRAARMVNQEVEAAAVILSEILLVMVILVVAAGEVVEVC